MAAPVGRHDPAVEAELLAAPFRFGFFQAVRLLERRDPARAPVGRLARPADEVARFRSWISLAFPPSEVMDAFKEVSAAQQTAQSYLNQARAYATQVTAKAEGEAAAFDKVYEQYRLAPEVTRRRMYYETMEKVLAKTDKTIVEAPVTPYLPVTPAQKPK